jgi:membrane-associated HD superfamily phosphohydrolase
MTKDRLLVPLFLFAAITVDCKSESTSEMKQDGASAQLAKAKAETKEAAQAMTEYAYTRKAEFVATMNKELVALQDDLDRLSAKAESSAGSVKAEAKSRLETAREKFSQTKNLLAQAEGSTESTWNGATGVVRQSYASLKDSVDETRRWLSDKIAP